MAATVASAPGGDKPVLALTSRGLGFYIAPMKWRNQLLALSCLLVFFALGVFYFKNWVVQKPFGIILFVGEGLDPARIAATRIYAYDATTPLQLDSLPYAALLKNYSKDAATPDEAAAATALATGAKVKNGTVGISADGKALRNLIELAREAGRMTGLVTDSILTDPTAASFYAHGRSKDDRHAFALELVENAHIDVVLGGGGADFLAPAKDGTRADDRDLLIELQDAGYDVVQTLEQLEEVPRWRRARLFGVFSPTELAFADDEEARANQPTLADMVRRAVELLQFNRGGYLLVVDAGLTRNAAQRNDGERTLLQTLELDRAVATALEYAGAKSMVIVCGDVAVGGMSLNGFPPRDASGAIWFSSTTDDEPSLTWATGPNGPAATSGRDTQEGGEPAAAPTATAVPSPPAGLLQPAAVYAKTARESVADVVALGSGPGADALRGTLESTRIFEIIQDNL
jgi:alkaline phosphatase